MITTEVNKHCGIGILYQNKVPCRLSFQGPVLRKSHKLNCNAPMPIQVYSNFPFCLNARDQEINLRLHCTTESPPGGLLSPSFAMCTQHAKFFALIIRSNRRAPKLQHYKIKTPNRNNPLCVCFFLQTLSTFNHAALYTTK